MLIDSHCHLDFPDFVEDFPLMLKRAESAGVEKMLSICTRLPDAANILSLAQLHPQIYATVGVHPHNVEERAEITLSELIRLTNHKKVVGIGETGLDYYYDHADRAKQRDSFARHIEAAQETQLPIIVHTRDAEEDTLRLLQEGYAKKPYLGLIHCFTASQQFAETVLDLGFYISISGIVTFKNATSLQSTVKTVPLDKILVETDSPYLAPVPHRGKRNEPAFVEHTARFVADLKGVPFEDLAKITTDNFYRLFGKVSEKDSGVRVAD